jgi:hypothetical protein
MKRLGIIATFVLLFMNLNFAQDQSKGFYSQLIGFKFGGEFFISSFLSDWSTAVFFENVINPFFGLEMEMAKASIPVTNYTLSGTAYYGNGVRDYIEMSGALKLYVQGFSFSMGLSYNNFVSGYIINTAGSLYVPMSNKEVNFFSFFGGPELTAQISADLFAKVGIRIIYGLINSDYNYTFGTRFYICFAYGI